MKESTLSLVALLFLGVIGLSCVAGVSWLVHERSDPAAIAILSGFGGTAVGALSMYLSPLGKERPAAPPTTPTP